MGRTKGSRNSPKPSTPNSGGGEIRPVADQPVDSAASNAESTVIDQVSIEGGDVTENVNELTNIVSDMTEIVTLVVDKEKEGAENWNQLKVRLDDIAKKHQKDKPKNICGNGIGVMLQNGGPSHSSLSSI